MEKYRKNYTGYPSIDKPWLKYYSQEAIASKMPECTIYEYLYENNKNHLDDYALKYLGRRIAFGKLFDNIDKAARAFLSIGVKAGEIVTLLTTNVPETVYVIYALNRIGAVVSLEYVTMNDEDILKNKRNNSSRIVVVLDVLAGRFPKTLDDAEYVIKLSPITSMPLWLKIISSAKMMGRNTDNYIDYKKFIALGKGQELKPSRYIKGKTAVLLHSGGTTGVPKCVELTDDNINAIPYHYAIGFEKLFHRGEVFMHCVPPFHAFGFSGIHMPLCLGLETAACVKFDEVFVAKEFFKTKPIHFEAGPSQTNAIVEMGEKGDIDIPWLKTFGVGGAVVTSDLQKKANDYFASHKSDCVLIVGYGMSELCGAVCATRNDCWKSESVGIPFSSVNVKVIDTDAGAELPYNKQGELCFASISLMKQYYKEDDETNNVIETDGEYRWMHTGDLGYIDEDGFIYISGRIKRIYPTMTEEGILYKLFPDYIEKTISGYHAVSECAVVCISDKKHKNVAVAFVVLQENYTDKDALNTFMETNLPPYSIPAKMVFIDSIPHTTAGKVDYHRLEVMVTERM